MLLFWSFFCNKSKTKRAKSLEIKILFQMRYLTYLILVAYKWLSSTVIAFTPYEGSSNMVALANNQN